MNNQQLSFTANLNNGINTVTITASNSNGSDTKSTSILYQPHSNPKPIVTITNPTVNPYTSSNVTFSLAAMVQNVSSQSEISVIVNGNPTNAFTYDMNSKVLTTTTNLNAGNNTFTVSATTREASDSKSQTVIYTAPVQLPPVVTIIYPSTNPFITGSQFITGTAKVVHVDFLLAKTKKRPGGSLC